jgi:hypothetical protein
VIHNQRLRAEILVIGGLLWRVCNPLTDKHTFAMCANPAVMQGAGPLKVLASIQEANIMGAVPMLQSVAQSHSFL